MRDVVNQIAAPQLEGSPDAEVTLVSFGSTWGVITEAIQQLAAKGVTVSHLHIKWIVPLHADAIMEALSPSKRTVIVENNYSGQFYRYLRSETGLSVDGHIRKYDGEPFMPHHIVDGVQELIAKKTDRYVPVHELTV
jgi:2-oxoglutarate ferredoxin oxidoreductase subunit alpha